MSAPAESATDRGLPAPYGLRFGGRVDPLGVPAAAARLSWAVPPSADVDAARGFEVRVFGDEVASRSDDGALWTARPGRPWTTYAGPQLGSRQRRVWRVRAFGRDGTPVDSPTASWETGLTRAEDWSARWVSAYPQPFGREGWDPCPHLRTEFDTQPGSARLFVTALGLYRVWLNGTELSAGALFRPGWTDYRVRVYHQSFDCEAALRPGRNVLAVVLAKGWYAGRLGLLREPGLWGHRPALLAQLEVDGRVVVASGPSWKGGYGALLAADLLRGEVQDRRQEPAGWHEPGWDDSGWPAAEAVAAPPAVVEPQPHESIATHRIHPGRLVHEHARGPAVFDFGQNLVGWTRLRTRCLPTVDLIVRHGEILTRDNLVYRDNLRGAFQEDRYTVTDEGPHRLEPSFTSHGFRYAEVWGLPSRQPYGSLEVLPDTSIEAVSVSGLGEPVGRFECSHEGLNRLVRNVEWTVRDNFLEVPTDCPQRDERHGWLGDAGVISATAAYLFDVSAFFGKFARDIADAQGPDGEIRNYAPAVPPANLSPGAPGWSDGYIRIVHLLAQRYGDLATAERLFDSMVAFLNHVDAVNPSGLRTEAVGADFGDWLSLPERDDEPLHTGYAYTGAHSTTPRPITDTAHSYRSFVQLAQLAQWLERPSEASRLHERAEQVRRAYHRAFVQPDGTIGGATQTAYAQAVGFGLVTGALAEAAAGHLRAAIERVGHLTTGIHGVQHALPVLSAYGHGDLAAKLLLSERMPGWLYMIGRGATTIWEKWDGIAPDGTLSTAEMNSFNHCALGAVGQYLFENVAGLRAGAVAMTGEIRIDCDYLAGLEWARASYDSPIGPIRSEWRRHGGTIDHELEVPGCARATVAVGAERVIVDSTHPAGTRELRLGPGVHRVGVREVTP